MSVMFAPCNISPVAKTSWLRYTARTLTCAAGGAANGAVTDNCLYMKRTVTSGESLHHKGPVVIFGDVEAGASVDADGDIIVLGRIHGTCHAARNGSTVFSMNRTGNVNLPKNASRLKPEESLLQVILNSSGPTRAALFTGAYITAAGISFYVFPNKLFELLFGVKNAAAGWIQAVATIAMVFGIYYVGAAVGDCLGSYGSSAFYKSTVVGRIFLFCSFCWLVVTGAVPPPLLIVGGINLVGALYMLRALQG